MTCGAVWLLPAGYCFGVELVVDNVITYYLYDQFRLNAVVAGAMGSIFGMVSVAGCVVFVFVCVEKLSPASAGMVAFCSGAWLHGGHVGCEHLSYSP